MARIVAERGFYISHWGWGPVNKRCVQGPFPNYTFLEWLSDERKLVVGGGSTERRGAWPTETKLDDNVRPCRTICI